MFTGGSLIVGAAARTDLMHRDRTEELAREQYASLRRLATLPDDVQVWPTHGVDTSVEARSVSPDTPGGMCWRLLQFGLVYPRGYYRHRTEELP